MLTILELLNKLNPFDKHRMLHQMNQDGNDAFTEVHPYISLHLPYTSLHLPYISLHLALTEAHPHLRNN